MTLRCLFRHDFKQLATSSETKMENDKEVWRKIVYCIVCTKCGELIELPWFKETTKEAQDELPDM